jgi:LEA14-like dessication related protein
MKSLWLRAIPVLACLFIATSCNSSSKLGGVPVSLTEYRPTALETQAMLTLHFDNENVFPLAIADTVGKLYLNGTYVGHFGLKEPLGMPQLSTANRPAILFIENTAFLQELRSSTSTPAISYRMEILMRLDVSEDKMKIKAVFSGQIDRTSLSAKPVAESKN